MADCFQILLMDTYRLYGEWLVGNCIHKQLIWQYPICVGLQDVGLDPFGSDLVETMCDKIGRNLTARYYGRLQ